MDFLLVDCRRNGSELEHHHFLHTLQTELSHHLHHVALDAGLAPSSCPTVISIDESGFSVHPPGASPHHFLEVIRQLDGDAPTGTIPSASPIASALKQCVGSLTAAALNRVLLVTSHIDGVIEELGALLEHIHATTFQRISMHLVFALGSEADTFHTVQSVATVVSPLQSAFNNTTSQCVRLSSMPAAIRQLFSRFRRRSAPIVIVFSSDERVFVEVSAAIAKTPEPVPVKLCGCHGSPASVTETGHAMLAASEARCMGPGKKLKAKDLVDGFVLSGGQAMMSRRPYPPVAADSDPELHVVSLLPLATLDESLLFGCSFVVAASRDVASFELDQMDRNSTIFRAMVAELRDRDVGMLLRSNFALECAAPCSNPQLLLPPRTPGHLTHYYMLQGAADSVGACSIKEIATRENLVEHGDLLLDSSTESEQVEAMRVPMGAVLDKLPLRDYNPTSYSCKFHDHIARVLDTTEPWPSLPGATSSAGSSHLDSNKNANASASTMASASARSPSAQSSSSRLSLSLAPTRPSAAKATKATPPAPATQATATVRRPTATPSRASAAVIELDDDFVETDSGMPPAATFIDNFEKRGPHRSAVDDDNNAVSRTQSTRGRGGKRTVALKLSDSRAVSAASSGTALTAASRQSGNSIASSSLDFGFSETIE